MFLNRKKRCEGWYQQPLLSILLTFFVISINSAHAQDKQLTTAPVVINSVSMTVSPNQCVAMTEGQTCYVDIELNWQSKDVGNFCIFSSLNADTLQCWTQASQGSYQLELASKRNVIFSIKRQGDVTVLGKVEVEMAWVHKRRGKPTNWWRLF